MSILIKMLSVTRLYHGSCKKMIFHLQYPSPKVLKEKSCASIIVLSNIDRSWCILQMVLNTFSCAYWSAKYILYWCMPQHIHEGQRKASGSLFSSTIWILEIRLESLGSVASSSTHYLAVSLLYTSKIKVFSIFILNIHMHL